VWVEFDSNRYSVLPDLARQTYTVRADAHEVRVVQQGRGVAEHVRSYDRRQLIAASDHKRAALAMSRRSRSTALEQAFNALGPEARPFHLCLRSQPAESVIHIRRLQGLARVHGSTEVVAAVAQALALWACDAAYVENPLLAHRRRRQLPSPTLPAPQRRELIDEIEHKPADPARYDRFCSHSEENSDVPT
jgi:hypothetical protein